jgi:Rrf2 family protein
MNKLFRVSEAANLALHAMALLASNPDKLIRTKQMALALRGSEAHLAKIMLILQHAGLVVATRGPAGGFKLAKNSAKISLKQIYEAIEGPIVIEKCIFSVPVCGGKKCILSGFFQSINRQVAEMLKNTMLSEVRLKQRS